MSKLDGKVAIVTGASKGIGAGIATELAKQGASVVVNYANSRTDADRVVEQIELAGGKAIATKANVANSQDVDRLMKTASDAFGPIDVLINNAGLFEFGSLESITEQQFSRLYSTNVWGAILVIQKALGVFNPSGGSIVNIGSGVTRVLSPGSALYAGSKGALDLASVVFAKELGRKNIRVNVLSPGATETEGAHAVGAMTDAVQRQYATQTPLGRVGLPSDIAKVAAFLASEDSAWITGENIHVSGGLR